MFDRQQDVVRLSLSDVRYEDRSRSVHVEIRSVTDIITDGANVEDVVMEYDDGEVLTLEISDDEIYLIVQWNDFDNRKAITKSYRIRGRVTAEISPASVDVAKP